MMFCITISLVVSSADGRSGADMRIKLRLAKLR